MVYRIMGGVINSRLGRKRVVQIVAASSKAAICSGMKMKCDSMARFICRVHLLNCNVRQNMAKTKSL